MTVIVGRRQYFVCSSAKLLTCIDESEHQIQKVNRETMKKALALPRMGQGLIFCLDF